MSTNANNFYPSLNVHTEGNAIGGPSVPYSHIQPNNGYRFHQPHEYVAVAALVVHVGTLRVNERIENVPMAARVSVVDYRGNAILDTYVRPTHHVKDYRTAETGLQYAHLANAPLFRDVQLQVSNIIHNKILVGHCLWNFLSVLGLSHPALQTRDLALFRPLRRKLKSRSIISLQILVHLFMGRDIGMGYEDSLELARASIDLFRCCERPFEQVIMDGAWPCNLPPSAYAQHFT